MDFNFSSNSGAVTLNIPLLNDLLDTRQTDATFYSDERVKKMSYIPNYSGGGASNIPVSTTSSYAPPPPVTSQQAMAQSGQNMSMLKRKMTLDLSNAKRPRVFSLNTPGVIDVLSSPDVQKLNIPTPELDRLIMNTNPNVLQTPTSVFFPKNVTEEQELYAKGFEQALKQMHDQDSAQSSVVGEESSNASSYKDGKGSGFLDFSNVVVKEEPQTVPDSYSDDDDDDSSLSDGDSSLGIGSGSMINPIDMESQEKIKLERKRQRNRLAASKCRRKKLERISKLEDKVKQLKNENSELGNVLVKLRESVQQLKSQVYEHVQAGCPIVLNGGNGGGSFT